MKINVQTKQDIHSVTGMLSDVTEPVLTSYTPRHVSSKTSNTCSKFFLTQSFLIGPHSVIS